jgi:hypothetical protein
VLELGIAPAQEEALMRAITGFLAGIFISTQALALDLGSLSNADAVGGLKDALPLNSLRSPPPGVGSGARLT